MGGFIMKDYFLTLLGPISTVIFSILYSFFFGNLAHIEYTTNYIEEDSYQTIFLIKNLQKTEQLKDINIVFNKECDLNTLFIDGKENKIIDNTLTIKNINPNSVKTIIIYSKQKIKKEDINFIKNNQKIQISYFNNLKNTNWQILIMAAFYAIINVICTYFLIKNQNKKAAETIKSNDEIRKVLEKTEVKLNENEKHLYNTIKKMDLHKALHIKEMAQMEKELAFYQKLLLKKYNDKLSKDELEKIISKELGTFNKKKFKHLSYNDLYKIIESIELQ